jgi:hypothetical protein
MILKIPFIFLFVCVLLLTMFRHEILTEQSLRINTFIRKLRILFIIIAGLFFVLSLLFNLLRVLDLGIQVQITYTQIAVFGLFLLSLVVFYCITSIRVLKMLAKSEKLSQRKRRTKRVMHFSFIRSLIHSLN